MYAHYHNQMAVKKSKDALMDSVLCALSELLNVHQFSREVFMETRIEKQMFIRHETCNFQFVHL